MDESADNEVDDDYDGHDFDELDAASALLLAELDGDLFDAEDDAFAALNFASDLNFRAGVSVTFVLFPCHGCTPALLPSVRHTLDMSAGYVPLMCVKDMYLGYVPRICGI